MTGAAAVNGVEAARLHARETVKRSGTSFAAGMAILPKPRREAMHAIYAFCREVDDIAADSLNGATGSTAFMKAARNRRSALRCLSLSGHTTFRNANSCS